MTDVTRRSLLAAAGVALTAGCLTDAGDRPAGGTATQRTTTATTDPGGTPRTESRERGTTDRTTTDRGRTTTDARSGTTAGDWIEHASNQFDPDHEITLANEADAPESVRISVERDDTGETVFETVEIVEPGAERSVWNLERADPEGVAAFTVCAELVPSGTITVRAGTSASAASTGQDSEASDTATTTTSERRDCVPLRTNECYGDAHVTVGADGTLRIIYAIC